MQTIGVIGLGNMGAPLASNLVQAGHRVVVFDTVGPERAPDGAIAMANVHDLGLQADLIVLSLPDGDASAIVCRQILDVGQIQTKIVLNTSTVGIESAIQLAELLASAGLNYVDAAVSGGASSAVARTLTVMYAASDKVCADVEPVLFGLSNRHHHVGDKPGMAQAMKLANNFLAATALAATSEAIAFGLAAGLDMGTMLEVLDASSGRSVATNDKFPNHVLTERYSSGFTNSLMAKDLRLYMQSIDRHGLPSSFGSLSSNLWEEFAAAEPGADFTRIYPFISRRMSD